MIANKQIFITGGAGFIGSTLIEKLIDENQITVFDNMTRDALSKKTFSSHKNLTIIKGDVLDYDGIKKAMAGTDYVVHAAGIAGIDTVIKKPVLTMEVNMVGSANVLRAAAEIVPDCERVICFSTSEVYGPQAFGVNEQQNSVIGALGEARWSYAVSKLAEEHLASAYYQERGLKTVVLRPFNVYGPGQVGEGAMKIFVEQALKGETLVIHGKGTQIRAWCYVDDMVQGTLTAMEHPSAVGESFNIGNARSVETIFGLANTVIRVVKSDSKIIFSGRQMADIELRIPNVDKAMNLINFSAKIDLEEGVERTAEWVRNQ